MVYDIVNITWFMILTARMHAGSVRVFIQLFGFTSQNGGNVGNAVGIERQKGRAARKRSWDRLRWKRIVFIIRSPC